MQQCIPQISLQAKNEAFGSKQLTLMRKTLPSIIRSSKGLETGIKRLRRVIVGEQEQKRPIYPHLALDDAYNIDPILYPSAYIIPQPLYLP